MGYARHIGRVGALAVTLGVGVAIATTPGIAYADPSGRRHQRAVLRLRLRPRRHQRAIPRRRGILVDVKGRFFIEGRCVLGGYRCGVD